jgi:hypothetical protein
MSIALKTHKMLWGRSGNRCAMPDCRKELVMDATETDDESLIGEECHIIAESPGGPRGNPTVPEETLNKYDNLILLCRIHHKVIDDQYTTYTVDYLREIKALHEDWVRESLATYDQQRQRDDELYAAYVETWLKSAHVAEWKVWTSHILGGDHPTLWIDVDESLSSLREWIFSRIWPRRYPELEDSFENFRRVLEDFQNTFHRHSKKTTDLYYTDNFCDISEWDEEKDEALSREFIFHVKLVEDLVLELTRAANFICERVRQYIERSFRLHVTCCPVRSLHEYVLENSSCRIQRRGTGQNSISGTGKIQKDSHGKEFLFRGWRERKRSGLLGMV